MLLVKGEIGRAAGVLYDAIRVNRWWPLQVWYWIGCRVLRGAKHA
jgi:hypothetical protein